MGKPLKPGLTVAVMVKNDAVRLRRCLESAKPIADAFVVLDTGSTDDSVEVARSFGAKVKEIEWPDAFDVAVNQLLDMVETEWTLRLDSDEWLLPETYDDIRAAMDDESFAIFLLGRDLLDGGTHRDQHRRRMWRTHPKMRVRGILHENFPPEALEEAAEGRTEKFTNILFMHDGYLGAEVSKEKRKRNIDLLKRELSVRPNHVYARIALAEEMLAVRDPMASHRMTELVDEALEDDAGPDYRHEMMVIPLRHELESMSDSTLRTRRAERILDLLMKEFSTVPLALWAVASVAVRRKDLQLAYRALRKLEALVEANAYDRVLPVDQASITTALWQTLAPLARVLGDQETADRNYARLNAG